MLASAIFLIVIMAALAAFVAQVAVSSQAASGQDVQGARALQAARLGIEQGLYAVQVNGTCAGGTLSGVAGLAGFKITWACTSTSFSEATLTKTLWEIKATACTTNGASCPSTTQAELQSADYAERQLVVLTER